MRTTFLALMAFVAAACSKDRSPDGARGTTTTTGAAADAGVSVEEIRSALLDQRPNSREAINAVIITNEGNTITLRGRVDDETMRREIVDIVKATPGVQGVHDQLQVTPPRTGQQPTDRP